MDMSLRITTWKDLKKLKGLKLKKNDYRSTLLFGTVLRLFSKR
jgi:hypothetical protein